MSHPSPGGPADPATPAWSPPPAVPPAAVPAGTGGAPAAVPVAAPGPAPAPGPATPADLAPGPTATRLTLETRRYWSGAAATALVAALVGVVGVLVLERILRVDLVVAGPGSAMVAYVLGGALAAAAAAALLHGLVLTTPRPRAFFGWILALATLLATLLPLTSTAGLGAGIATGVVNLLVGIAIWSLLSGVLGWTVRRVRA